MVKRKHISLIYQYNNNWIGGAYYILNIIRALNVLPNIEKPFLTIYYTSDSSLDELKNISYPYIEYVKCNMEFNFFEKGINALWLKFIKKEFFIKTLPAEHIDNFYYKTFAVNSSNINKYYFWIPDFQDLYLPEFFKP